MRPADRVRAGVNFMAEYCQMPPWDGDLQCALTIIGVCVIVVVLSLLKGRSK